MTYSRSELVPYIKRARERGHRPRRGLVPRAGVSPSYNICDLLPPAAGGEKVKLTLCFRLLDGFSPPLGDSKFVHLPMQCKEKKLPSLC